MAPRRVYNGLVWKEAFKRVQSCVCYVPFVSGINSGKNFFTQQFACTLGFGCGDKEEEGPIGFLAGGPKI